MRVLLLFFLLSGCMNIAESSDSVITAQPYIGLDERVHRQELREFMDVDPVRVEWCAAFVNSVLEIDGIPGSSSVSEYPLTARSFLKWGNKVDPADIQRGDVVVFPRGNSGWQGHVGFYVDTHVYEGREWWIILGGNQKNEVRYDFYSPNRALGIRRWTDEINNP